MQFILELAVFIAWVVGVPVALMIWFDAGASGAYSCEDRVRWILQGLPHTYHRRKR